MQGFLLFAPAVIIGFSLVRLLLTRPSGWTGVLLQLSLGCGAGVGVVAAGFFTLLWAGVTGRIVVLVLGIGGAVGLGWMAFRQGRTASEAVPSTHSSWIWPLRGASALACLLFVLDAGKSIDANPHGEWDAFSIWNLKAKFLAAGPEAWRTAMAPVAGGTLVGANHPGYPLLLPSAVAAAWTVQGETASMTPAALSILFALAAAGLLCGAVALFSGEASGLLAVLLLLASEGFASQAGSQEADIPLSFYLLATIVLLAFAAGKAWPRGLLVLAGLCCGLAAWTKNEGIPFLIVTLGVVAWRGGMKSALTMSIGALPVATLAAVFKLLLVHDREAWVPSTPGEAMAGIGDVSRWKQIAASFGQSVWQMGTPWTHPILLAGVLALACGVAPRERIRRQLWLAIPVFGLLAVDFVVYLISTADLTWHLETSNRRLLVQVWPVLLFLLFLVIAPPKLANAATTPTAVRTKPPGKKRSKA